MTNHYRIGTPWWTPKPFYGRMTQVVTIGKQPRIVTYKAPRYQNIQAVKRRYKA